MAAEGVVSPFDIAELSILGWIEGLRAYGKVKRRVAETAALAERERPDAVVLIDSWGFTIRVAQAIRAARPDVPLIKYVGPQVWASRPGRAKTLAGAVDHLLALYGFDAPWFEREGAGDDRGRRVRAAHRHGPCGRGGVSRTTRHSGGRKTAAGLAGQPTQRDFANDARL